MTGAILKGSRSGPCRETALPAFIYTGPKPVDWAKWQLFEKSAKQTHDHNIVGDFLKIKISSHSTHNPEQLGWLHDPQKTSVLLFHVIAPPFLLLTKTPCFHSEQEHADSVLPELQCPKPKSTPNCLSLLLLIFGRTPPSPGSAASVDLAAHLHIYKRGHMKERRANGNRSLILSLDEALKSFLRRYRWHYHTSLISK